MKCITLMAVLMLVCACASKPTRIRGTGEEAPPPSGWLEYCQRNPEDKGCINVFDGVRTDG